MEKEVNQTITKDSKKKTKTPLILLSIILIILLLLGVTYFYISNKNKEPTNNVPLLGKVTAGSPIEAIEVPNEFFSLPAYLIPKKKEVFTLRVDGESMINKGILSNDIVIVERCENAKNGDMVVAMNDNNEVTLKTFYKENGHFRLQPENDYMEPIILDNVTILGKAIGLFRKF